MKYLRWVIILTLVAIAVWRLSPHFGDFSKIYSLKDEVAPIWIAAAILTQIGQYLGDGWLSQILLKMVGFKISFEKIIKIASLNVFAAHIMPIGEAGSLATIYYFYKKLGVSNQGIIFLSLVWTTITSLALVLLFFASLPLLPKLPYLPNFSATNLIYIVAAITVFFLLITSLKKIILATIKSKLSHTTIFRELVKFKDNINIYKEDLLKNKFQVFLCFIAAFIYYLSNIATLSFSFLAFGHLPNLAVIICAYTLSLLAGIVTLAPAGIGATEATLLVIFLQFNVHPAQTVAAILVFRLISFWLPIPAGAFSYFSLKREIAEKPLK